MDQKNSKLHPTAKILGLDFERFYFSKMSEKVEDLINDIKKKDRSELKISEWDSSRYSSFVTTRDLMMTCQENIIREDYNDITVEEFREKYEKNKIPVVFTNSCTHWKGNWEWKKLYSQYKNEKFKIGEDDDGNKLKLQLKYFMEYLVYQNDDSPLYLFESSIENLHESEQFIKDFEIPKFFKEDFMSILGEKKRPPFRWFLIGPERSGTSIHKDPLSTSAWNTSIHGHKRWVLFPSHLPKSIVKGKEFAKSSDQEAITYFKDVLPQIIRKEGRNNLGIIEFIQRPGDTVYVPGDWWHAVVNCDNTMAVTQNYMNSINFDDVWKSFRLERQKIASCFLKKAKRKLLKFYERAIELNAIDNFFMAHANPIAIEHQKKKRDLSFSTSFDSKSSGSSSSSSSNLVDSSGPEEDCPRVSRYSRSRSQSKKRTSSKPKKRALSQNPTGNTGSKFLYNQQHIAIYEEQVKTQHKMILIIN